MDECNNIEQIADLAIAASKVETSIPYAVLPQGYSLKSLEDFMVDENQVKQSVAVQTASSLVAYVARYKDERTVIFADKDKTLFHAVIDYHLNSATPEKATHDVTYDCPLSDEWRLVLGYDKEKLNQVEFAEFLEQNINLIAPVGESYAGPSGAELLQMVLSFQETRESVFKSVQRLQDGTCQFSFSDEKAGHGNTQLPERISLAISPFRNGLPYQMDARIRYRLRDGRLFLWYELIEPQKIIDHAFNEILVDLQNQLPDVPVFEGRI